MKLIQGKGQYYKTAGGRWMLDFTSGGIFQAILGNSAYLAFQAAQELTIETCYAPHHTNKWTERYKDMLKEWTGFESVVLFTTGAEATEAFWRCCRTYNGKLGIWGGLVDPDEVGTNDPKPDAMHGWTNGALVMAGKITEPALGSIKFGQNPEYTSCMIMEPYHAPSGQFHKIDPTINRILAHQEEHKHIPLCIDEIQGGFGRTGKQFAHHWYKGVDRSDLLQPDFITIGKAAGSGLPISALLGPKEIMESKDVKKHGHLHSTHSGHPLMCQVGSRVIEDIDKNNLIQRSFEMGTILEDGLKDCGVRHHAGRGLMAGLEFKDAKEANRMARTCQKRGLLVIPTGRKWVKIGPALTIDQGELDAGIKIIRDSIVEVLDARNAKTRRSSG